MSRLVPFTLLVGAVLSAFYSSASAQAKPDAAAAPTPAAPMTPVARTYRVEQKVTLSAIPESAKSVRWWIAIPDEASAQELLDLQVTSAPGKWSVEREAEHGDRFLYVEAAPAGKTSLEATVEFTFRRHSVFIPIDPAKVGELTDAQRALFAGELRRDAPHMSVTDEIARIADQTCGAEKNLALQARKLLDYVADHADHYSKDPTKPKCGIGDAGDCMANQGGCCTDLHSLFVALARARGIPARMQFGYRLLEKNRDKTVDPGYRCWPEYFVPGYGWVPADVVEGDSNAADALGRDRWFTGLTERRVHLAEGRDFVLTPRQSAPARVNSMIIGYAEIDGVPARVLPEGEKQPQLARTVHFVELADDASAALNPPGAAKSAQ